MDIIDLVFLFLTCVIASCGFLFAFLSSKSPLQRVLNCVGLILCALGFLLYFFTPQESVVFYIGRAMMWAGLWGAVGSTIRVPRV